MLLRKQNQQRTPGTILILMKDWIIVINANTVIKPPNTLVSLIPEDESAL